MLWEELLINILGAFIGFALAYLLYRWQVKRSQEDKLVYVLSLINNTIKHITTQAGYCRELAESIRSAPINLHGLTTEANYEVNRLANKLDQESFYHAYLSKYK